MSLPEVNGERVDPERWIKTSACSQADLLLGNSHTFRGRMYAYCPHDEEGYSVSLHEITAMSTSAEQWIDGFLAGSEPEPADMFGAESDEWDSSDPRLDEWRRVIGRYRRTGIWPPPPE
ncbi:MAG: hypothetical protein Q8K63_06140 [Acidimicrobiales bacterium]|nr:hypothetical protein [Acidimicrobiales bacterium]